MRGVRFFETIWQDLRFALRTMRKTPVFSLILVLTLALGIGANTAMFSVIHAVLLKPLGYQDADRVVLVSEQATPIRFEEMRLANQSCTELGAFANGFENVALSGMGEPEVLKGARVSANFLRILGVSALIGRSFRDDEDKPGALPVVMLSHEVWQRRFGRDPLVIGRSLTLDGTPHTVIGVLPAEFQFPFAGADIWLARPSEWSVVPVQSRPMSPILSIFGRLKPRVDMQQANAELALLNRQYAIAHPEMLDAKPDAPERVRPLKDQLVSDIRAKLWMLFGAVALVLLIVCANVASMLLARSTARSREFALRAAIGAGRGRIIGQLLAESISLAVVGGSLGVALAAGSLIGIRSITSFDLPRAGEIRIDAPVLVFAVALSIVTGILFGMVPLLTASRPDLNTLLRGSGEGAISASARTATLFNRLSVLVVGQVSLSIVLLIGATLLIQSLVYLYRVDPGFQPVNLLTMKIALSPARYDTDEKRAMFYAELVKRVESLPGIRSAAVTLTLPMSGFVASTVQLPGKPVAKAGDRPISIIQSVTPEYFSTLKIALVRGREFNAHDNAGAVPVMIINEKLAHLLWTQYPNGLDPIGQYLLIGSNPRPKQIIGISSDVRQTAKNEDPRPGLYIPSAQKPSQSAMLAVRTDRDPLLFANAVHNEVFAIDHDQPISEVTTMDELVEASQGQLRLMMRLLGLFASIATLFAVVGLYGIVSYSVVQRTREIGIRRALGAQPMNIILLVVKQGIVLSVVGILLGTCAAFALTRVMSNLLFEVSATDTWTFLGVAILFLFVGLTASYIPARRAIRMNPSTALRVG